MYEVRLLGNHSSPRWHYPKLTMGLRSIGYKTKRPRLRLESWDALLNSPPPELLICRLPLSTFEVNSTRVPTRYHQRAMKTFEHTARLATAHAHWRRGAESNRRSGFCRPTPYHLATAPYNAHHQNTMSTRTSAGAQSAGTDAGPSIPVGMSSSHHRRRPIPR